MRSRTYYRPRWDPQRRARCLRVIRAIEQEADFQSAVLAALERDEGDGLEQGYHTLHTLIEYGIGVVITGDEVTIQNSVFHRWTVELRYGSIFVSHTSDEDAITVLKEAFFMLRTKMLING